MILPESGLAEQIETDHTYPNVHVEMADHPNDEAVDRDLRRRILSGDLSAYSWNPEVGERLSSYQPEILTIDGSQSQQPWDQYRGNPLDILLNTWQSLPTRPAALHSSQSIFAVQGDVLGDSTKAQLLSAENQVLRDLLRDMPDLGWQDKTKFFAGVEIEHFALLAVATMVGRVINRLRNQSQAEIEEGISLGPMFFSRRKFLKTAGAAALLGVCLPLARNGAPWLAARTTSTEAHNRWQTIVTAARPRLFRDEWVDGRTALLISKHMDAMDFLGLPPETTGAVVLGYDHGYEAARIMDSPTVRAAQTANLASIYIDIIDKVIDKDHPEISKQAARGVLLDFIAKTDVIRVTDPGKVSRSTVVDALSQAIVPAGLFHSASVEAAIKNLR